MNALARRPRVVFASILLALFAALVPGLSSAETSDVVVWISIDGLRGDYATREDLPFFQRLRREGAWTSRLQPNFPTLTFPSHVSQATGANVDTHGVTANSLWIEGQEVRYPAEARLLGAEPIWITAKRQGIRVAVFDWPLSQNETGPIRADYFLDKFTPSLTGRERLNHLLDVWRSDTITPPLRLLMGYVGEVDRAGHRSGPDSPETKEAVRGLDASLSEFLEAALDLWKERRGPKDHFYLVLTTDHGMSHVTHLVNPNLLPGLSKATGAHLVISGPLANVHLDALPEGERPERARKIVSDLQSLTYLKAWSRKDLPAEWHYAHPTRTGDVVIMLKPGYTFSSDVPERMGPVDATRGPGGMHGYPVESEPKMEGFACVWRTPDPIGGTNLGVISNLQFHPTVAHILGIEPSPAAKAERLKLSAAP